MLAVEAHLIVRTDSGWGTSLGGITSGGGSAPREVRSWREKRLHCRAIRPSHGHLAMVRITGSP